MQLSQETPAERAHHEAILASISMIDDIGMQTARIPLCHEKNDDCLDFFYLFISLLVPPSASQWDTFTLR